MLLLVRADRFSQIGVSAAGGVSHNMGQLIMAMLILRSSALLYYAPVLIISGALTGALMGVLANRVMYIFKGTLF